MESFHRPFQLFTCCSLIDDRIFCMHGGLSPKLEKTNDINSLYRPSDVPDSGNNLINFRVIM